MPTVPAVPMRTLAPHLRDRLAFVIDRVECSLPQKIRDEPVGLSYSNAAPVHMVVLLLACNVPS